MEELCDIISQRLSIKSVILQVCGADHSGSLLGVRVPKFVDFVGCLTALMLQIASRRSSFSDFAQCTHYHIHISSYQLCPPCPRVLPYGFGVSVPRPVMLKHWLLKIVSDDNVVQ